MTDLLYTHAWRPDEAPWIIKWVNAANFADMAEGAMTQYGLNIDGSLYEFERHLSLESSKAKAAISNRGRIALEEARIEIDEYLLVDCDHDIGIDSPRKNSNRSVAPRRERGNHSPSERAVRIGASRRQGIGVKAARDTPDQPTVDSMGMSQRRLDNSASEPSYIPYPRAMKILRERLGATPAELAVWVSFGAEPDCGGIPAYLEANITATPRKLDFDCWPEADFDYIAPLMGAWFLVEDIKAFKPADRFMEYSRFVDRWQGAEQILDVHAYISAKVREDSLHEFHPVTANSQLSLPDYEYARPARETTLLCVADIEAIERDEDIEHGIADTPNPEFVAVDESLPPENSRRERRKRETELMYQAWQNEYQRLRKLRPKMGKKWCASQIARMDIAFSRDAETIRRRLT